MKKSNLSLLFLFSLMFYSCSEEAKPDSSEGAAVSSVEPVKITILHFNDTHSRLMPFTNAQNLEVGGISRRGGYISTHRKRDKNLLVLDAGDFMTGSVFCTVFRGEMDIELYNLLGITAATIGNHEIDFGVKQLLRFRDMAQFPLLSANILQDNRPIQPEYLTTNLSGVRLVIIGISSTDQNVYNRDAVNELEFRNQFVVLSNLLFTKELRKTNDIVILLTHVGYIDDIALARSFPEADLIFGGHSHTQLDKPNKIGNTLIMQAKSWGEYGGRLELFIRDKKILSNTYRLDLIDASYPENPKISKILKKRNDELKAKMDEVVCELAVNLVQPALGNMLADMFMEEGKAQIGIINAGGIRKTLNRGTMTVRDMFEVQPFDNRLAVCTIKGSTLRKIIERTAKNGSRIDMYYSKTLAVKTEKNIPVEILIEGKPLAEETTYTVALSDFVFFGGDGYAEFSEALEYEETSMNCREALIAAFRKKGVIERKDLNEIPRIIPQ